MSANETWLDDLLPKFTIYILQGIFLSFGNGIIFVAIVRQNLLRGMKQYLIVAGLALADFLNGVATFSAGVARIFYITQGLGNKNVSRWECLLTPWNEIYIWSDPLQSIMLLVVSIDRVLAVGWPLQYYGYGTKYAHKMNGVAYGFIAVLVAIGHILSYQYQDPEKPIICLASYSLDDTYYRFQNYCRVIPGTLSIIVYCGIGVFFFKNNSVQPQALSKTAYNREQKIQRKLTITLGISSIFTLIFYVIPILIETFYSHDDTNSQFRALIIPYIFIINNFNPMMNFALYTLKQKDMKLAVKCLFNCKKMTIAMVNAQTTTIGHRATTKSQNFIEIKTLGPSAMMAKPKSLTAGNARKYSNHLAPVG